MDESTLRASIKTLESSIDSYDSWLNILAGIVAIGVILEIVFVIHAYLESKSEWKRGIMRPPDRPSKKWLWFEIAGVLLVSLGVSGEFWIDVRVGELATQLRKANADLVVVLETRVEGTATVAAKAKKDSEAALIAFDAVGLAAARAVESTRVLGLEVSTTRAQLESATRELKRQGPRYALFVGKPRDDFREALKPFVGQKLLIRTRSNGGAEEDTLKLMLTSLLWGRWTLTTDNTSPFWSPEVNLGIPKGKSSESTVKAAAALATALGAIGVGDVNGENPLRIEDFPELPPDTIGLMIGEHIARSERALNGARK